MGGVAGRQRLRCPTAMPRKPARAQGAAGPDPPGARYLPRKASMWLYSSTCWSRSSRPRKSLPTCSDSWGTLLRSSSEIHRRGSETALALEYYARASKLAPRTGKDRALIFREYGILLRAAATPDAAAPATEALEIALQETPNDPVCIYVPGQVLCRRSMFSKAKPLLEKLASSGDLRGRQSAYPVLKKCSEHTNDVLALSYLRGKARRDGVAIQRRSLPTMTNNALRGIRGSGSAVIRFEIVMTAPTAGCGRD